MKLTSYNLHVVVCIFGYSLATFIVRAKLYTYIPIRARIKRLLCRIQALI